VIHRNRALLPFDVRPTFLCSRYQLHPDKNSAPHADEAFKAVGLAYATLSDPQKRTIYDRYGDEDPDNVGGGMRPGGGGGGVHFRPGQDVSPEEIFNMFFGGGMPGGMHMRGGPGMHFYSNFGGPGMRGAQFGGGRRPQQQQQAQQEQAPGLANLMQFLPFILIMALSFFNNVSSGGNAASSYSAGENKYFSLTVCGKCRQCVTARFAQSMKTHTSYLLIPLLTQQKDPFLVPMHTTVTNVKEIPYFVSNNFMRTYYRDRYQLSQVEMMVEKAYENYLVNECNSQKKFKRKLSAEADRKASPAEVERARRTASDYELTRCVELNDLFPLKRSGNR